MTGAATLERRHTTELRAAGRRLEGYAATFASTADFGLFAERIAPGAFQAALAGDILALLDHDPGKVLGRVRSGTLRLNEDARGLAFSLDLPDTQSGRDVQALAERGDLGGMSFGFTVPEGGEEWQGKTRTLRTIDLKEVSVVSAWPAYEGTEIALRSLQRGNERQRRARALKLAEARQWAF
ncbi:MAG: HK97 family phage prohead protease [Porphyrobacter sp.]|nr:HK97 family phage prohead protease [Porphyrobacter sp.]